MALSLYQTGERGKADVLNRPWQQFLALFGYQSDGSDFTGLDRAFFAAQRAQGVHWVTDPAYGASTSNTAAENTASVHAAVAAMADGDELVVPFGDFTCDPLTLDLPDYATLRCLGRFVVAQNTSSPAVTLGSSSALRLGYRVHALRVTSDTAEGTFTATVGSIGVRLLNMAFANIDLRDVYGYETNVQCKGQGAVGFALNEIHIGRLRNSKYTMHLTTATGGWCTSNTFFGGSWQHGSNMASFVGAEHLVIDHDATYPIEDNLFIAPKLESEGATKCGTIHGYRIHILNPRVEGPTPFELTANSAECNLEGPYFDYSATTDSGSTNNVLGTQSRFLRGRTSGDTKGILNLHNRGGNAEPLITFYGGAHPGTRNGYIDGNAAAYLLGLTVGASGSKITGYYRGSRAIDFPSVANGAATADTVTVTGAAAGTNYQVLVSATAVLPTGVFLVGQCTAANTVTVQLVNLSGAAYDATSMTVHVAVITH